MACTLTPCLQVGRQVTAKDRPFWEVAHHLVRPLRSCPVSGQSHPLSCCCHYTTPVCAHVFLFEGNLKVTQLSYIMLTDHSREHLYKNRKCHIPLSTPLYDADTSCTSFFDLIGDQFPSSLNWISSHSEQLLRISINNL